MTEGSLAKYIGFKYKNVWYDVQILGGHEDRVQE